MMRFPGQKEGEVILDVVHKHPVVYIKISLAFILFVILPTTLFLHFWFRAFPLSSNAHLGIIAGLASILYFLYGLLFIYIRLTDEEFDVMIVTSDRLVGITQVSFFHKNISSAPLEQIEDTTSSISGFLPTLFHYGDLTVKTGNANADTFFIDHISDPEGVGRRILDAVHRKQEALRGEMESEKAIP
jgi:hypothetical protein